MNSLRMSFWMVPASCSLAHPLLLGRDDVERQDRQHRAVHRHRHAHLVERDAVEQLAHVVDRVDRDAGHADVARDPRVVAVVAAVGRQVERDRQALLPGGEVAPVERVGLLGGGEPGVLPDRPRLVDVHRRVRPAQVRRQARVGVQEVEPVQVGRRCRAAATSMPSGVAHACPLSSPARRRPAAAVSASCQRFSSCGPGADGSASSTSAKSGTSQSPVIAALRARRASGRRTRARPCRR